MACVWEVSSGLEVTPGVAEDTRCVTPGLSRASVLLVGVRGDCGVRPRGCVVGAICSGGGVVASVVDAVDVDVKVVQKPFAVGVDVHVALPDGRPREWDVRSVVTPGVLQGDSIVTAGVRIIS